MGVVNHPTLANINLKSILLLGTTPLRIGSLDVKGAEEGTWELSPWKEAFSRRMQFWMERQGASQLEVG